VQAISGWRSRRPRGDSIDVALTEGRQAIHLAYPAAFEGWMRTMVGNYLRAAQNAGHEPDQALLAPIRERGRG